MSFSFVISPLNWRHLIVICFIFVSIVQFFCINNRKKRKTKCILLYRKLQSFENSYIMNGRYFSHNFVINMYGNAIREIKFMFSSSLLFLLVFLLSFSFFLSVFSLPKEKRVMFLFFRSETGFICHQKNPVSLSEIVTFCFKPGLSVGMRGTQTGQENVCHPIGLSCIPLKYGFPLEHLKSLCGGLFDTIPPRDEK